MRADIQPKHHTDNTIQRIAAGECVQVQEQNAVRNREQHRYPHSLGMVFEPWLIHGDALASKCATKQ
jgi:hypothetical protein